MLPPEILGENLFLVSSSRWGLPAIPLSSLAVAFIHPVSASVLLSPSLCMSDLSLPVFCDGFQDPAGSSRIIASSQSP